jgi:predicted small secreted protein
MRQSRWLAMLGLGGPALILGLSLAGCGDTWRGVKKDTGQNMEAVGESVDKAGEKVEDSAEQPPK